MTNEDIEASREVCDAATPGPWEWSGNGPAVVVADIDPRYGPQCHIADCAPLDAAFIAHARTALPQALDEIERLRNQWRCFNCGFTTSDPKEAEAHFGDMDEGTALCVDWAELDSDGRASAYQDVIRELNKERDFQGEQREEIDTLKSEIERLRAALRDLVAGGCVGGRR